MNAEYRSVLCAALLHDIGKFVQRGADEREKHWVLSEAFVENFRSSFENPDLVKTLVRRHHEGQNTDTGDHPQSLEDPRQRVLAYLVSRADNFASSERPDESHNRGFETRAALDGVFSQIDIGVPCPETPSRYPLGRLFEGESIYPRKNLGAQHAVSDYEQHFDRFREEFAALFTAPYPEMAETLLALLQKYLWCIPSDTTRTVRDISLADHSKVTCAIAACMYQFHQTVGWDEALVLNSQQTRLRLVCGDLSGIQDYLYKIAEVGAGEVAKRLRARSFRISALTEAIALRILKVLDLPLACKIMAAGGQFYLLIPNTDTACQALKNEIEGISRWLLDDYSGDLAVSIADIELPNADLQQGKFDSALKLIRAETARVKSRKFADLLAAGPKVFEMQFKGHKACKACGIKPASTEDETCSMCRTDETIGRKLAQNDDLWLVISENRQPGAVCFFGDWWASLVRKEQVPGTKPLLALNLRGSELLAETPCAFSPHAGYVPRWDPDEYRLKADKNIEEDISWEAVKSGEAVKSFSRLAAESEGTNLLGVLRADVDNLGLIFTLGIEGRASLSRVATLSSFMNAFFSWELTRLVREEYPSVYVAYAGGDDLMLVGPWNQMIALAREIQERFTRFTGGNPNLTLSAGIGTFRPKTPIALTSQTTGEILEHAKSGGRDSLSLFNVTLKWSEYPALEEWVTVLKNGLEESDGKGGSKALLYRLYNYQKQALRHFHGEKTEACSALYRPHLAYDIGRNLSSDHLSEAGMVLRERLIQLIGADANDWRLIPGAITWCSYLLRKEK